VFQNRFGKTKSFSTHFDPAQSFSANWRWECSRKRSTMLAGRGTNWPGLAALRRIRLVLLTLNLG